MLIEIPYFSVDKYPKVCVYSGRKDMRLEADAKYLSQCTICADRQRVNNLKRKLVDKSFCGRAKSEKSL